MRDLDAARRDLRAFADLAGRPLTEWQAEALRLPTRFTVLVAPRQSGKSRSLSVLALWWAFTRPGSRVLIVSAGEEAARRLLGEVRSLAASSALLASSVVDELSGLLTLDNGSEVRSTPASERQIRGWSVDLLLIDEAALVSDELITGAALPTTSARPEARIVLASSPLTTAGAFFDFAMRGEADSEHVTTHRWRLTDAEWISPSVVEAARESLSPARFACEYEGEFASGSDLLIARHVLDRATADYAVDDLATMTGAARGMLGLDWGARRDRSACVVLARMAGTGRRFGVRVARRWPAGEPVDNVIREVASSPGAFAYVNAEANAMQSALCDLLFGQMRRRPAALGGGAPLSRAVVVDEEELDAWALRRRRRERAVGRLPIVVPGAIPVRTVGQSSARPFRAQLRGVSTSAPLKAAAYAELAAAIERERLLIPTSAEDLRRELATLRIELTPTGVERIEAPGVAADDLADAAMLATTPYVGADRRWRTRLSSFCNPDKWRGEEPALDGLDLLPTATTGGGVVIPKHPAWASVASAEVSPPAGVRQVDAAEHYRRRMAGA